MQDQDVSLMKRCVNGIMSNFDYQRKELTSRWLKDLKTVVRKNETIIGEFVDKLFEEFNKSNSDRRLGAMLLTDYFFQRSHKFRLELIEHIQDLILFTIETDPLHYPLPPPAEAAIALKKDSLKIIRAWIEKFADGYSKLNVASQYLSQCKHFDFQQANEQLLVERRRAEEEQNRQAENAKKVRKAVKKEFKEVREEIDRSLAECRNAMNLLYPDLFKHGEDNLPSTSSELTEERKKLHGLKKNEEITIVIDSAKIDIRETPNNSPLIDALHDSQILLNKYQKQIKKWIKAVIQVGGAREHAQLIRVLVEYKAQVTHELKRSQQLNIKRSKLNNKYDSESDDSDFEDVVMEELELGLAPPDLFNTNSSMKDTQEETNSIDEPKPGPSNADEPSTSKKIPTVAFGLDLKYWGQDVEPATIPRNEFDGHPFWRASDPSDTFATEVEDVYRSRQMTFAGERPTIKHQCRAPLPSGKLCIRMDLETCPFHGPIIQRDEQGFPIGELGKGSIEHIKMVEERMRKKAEEEEQTYLKDLEATTGISFTNPRKRLNKNSAYGTARKREKTQTEMSKERLAKKLFNKSAIKRVTETLTTIQQQRAEKQFSSQFNYALNRR